jgi:hypothetical protein
MPASQGASTTDHDEIRRWAEGHDGKPASVRGTGDENDPGILRIDFPGGAGEDELEQISWDDWFEKFEQQQLAAIIQERKADGEPSTFMKLVKRDSVDKG